MATRTPADAAARRTQDRPIGPATARPPRPLRERRRAFFVWAAILSLVSGVTFLGVTLLTIGLWLAGRNADTTPVTDLGFFALGAIVTAGLAVQLRTPERQVAGLQQAIVGMVALAVAGLIGWRVEPLIGAAVLLAATSLLVALHPARRALFTVTSRPSAALTALALLAALPATVYAASMLDHAREAGPSCFFGRCAYGDRFAELAALAVASVTVGLLSAFKPTGWRITAWCAGGAAVILGAASVAWPDYSGSLGLTGGAVAVLWGAGFVAAAERERRVRPRT